MAGARNNTHPRRRAGHSLSPLEICEEGELCLHAMHMVLWVEDGMEGDALNARAGCHQWMEPRKNRQQRAENPHATIKGVLEAGKLDGASSTRLAPGGEENSGDPTMIGYNHSLHKTNQQHECQTSERGLLEPMGSSLPRASAVVK